MSKIPMVMVRGEHTDGSKGQKKTEGLRPGRDTCSNHFLALNSVLFKLCKD